VKNAKKKVRNDNWKRKRAKVCRNLGLEYVSDRTNKVVPAKQQGVGCKCSARPEAANVKWCKYHVLGKTERDDILFYKICDYNAQNAFLFGLISRQECKEKSE
jgi:hypothetical protein